MENVIRAPGRPRRTSASGVGSQRGDTTQKAIRDAAVSMISELGYHAVTLRKLADRVGIQAGSLYNHIENKQELIFKIITEIMSDLLQSFEERVAHVKGPQDRLDAFIVNHIAFHTSRKDEVFIGNMELRSLSSKNRARIVLLRDRYQKFLIEILREGQKSKIFKIQDVRMLALAVLGMLNSVADWFNPDGPESADDIAKHYIGLIHSMVGVKPSRRRTRG